MMRQNSPDARILRYNVLPPTARIPRYRVPPMPVYLSTESSRCRHPSLQNPPDTRIPRYRIPPVILSLNTESPRDPYSSWENPHHTRVPHHRIPLKPNPSNQTRKRLFEGQRIDTTERTPTKTDTQTTFENQRDIKNHGKISHEINTGGIIFRDTKEPIRMTEKSMKSNTKTTLRNKGTTQVTGRSMTMKSNTKRILRDTKNRYEREKKPWQQTRRRFARTMGRQPTKARTKRDFERQRTDTNGRTTYENTDMNTEDTFRTPKRHCEPWEDNPWNRTRHRLFEKDKPREQIRRGLSRTVGSLPIMRRQPMKLPTKTIFWETKNRYKWKDNLIPMQTDTKTTVGHQRDVTNHGKTTHETKRETDFSRDKESIRPKGQPTKSDTKTTSENQKLFQQWEDNPWNQTRKGRHKSRDDDPWNPTRQEFFET